MMQLRHRWGYVKTVLALAVGCSCLPALPGCGNSSNRQPISGTVTLDGQPLVSGVISFRPAKGLSAPGSGAGVIEGRFDIPEAKGLEPGKYDVTIAAFRETNRKYQTDPSGPEMSESVPIKFNEADQLKAAVVAGGKNHFQFPLTPKE